MAVSTWPSTLPQVPQKGYTETGGVLILSTPQDSGPPKLRRRGNSPQKLSVTFLMNETQVTDFETFVTETLRGVKRFNFPHPRLKEAGIPKVVEVRIIPRGTSDLYNVTYMAPTYWTISFDLEVLL